MIFDFQCLSFELKVCKGMKNLHPFILIFFFLPAAAAAEAATAAEAITVAATTNNKIASIS